MVRLVNRAIEQISKALRENINYIWLGWGNQPDFRTLNRFRGQVVKGAIDEIIAAVLELLIEEGYIQLEHYFVDGTKVEANANRHKLVWAKSRKRYEERLQQKVKKILDEVERVNRPKMKRTEMTTRTSQVEKARSMSRSWDTHMKIYVYDLRLRKLRFISPNPDIDYELLDWSPDSQLLMETSSSIEQLISFSASEPKIVGFQTK